MNNKKLGNAGENLACQYRVRNGYEILEKNKSYPKICEIDIIAKRKDKFYFVEVKTRSSNAFGEAKDAVDKNKLTHIRKGAMLYLETMKYKFFQIDVIAITLKPELKIEHYRNVG